MNSCRRHQQPPYRCFIAQDAVINVVATCSMIHDRDYRDTGTPHVDKRGDEWNRGRTDAVARVIADVGGRQGPSSSLPSPPRESGFRPCCPPPPFTFALATPSTWSEKAVELERLPLLVAVPRMKWASQEAVGLRHNGRGGTAVSKRGPPSQGKRTR
ncbi:hypothetical protein CDD80_7086 [Ophiocordyceps camponoti-rufipedis]|uniref:Uncharacterized protein n=1 Tax=Ophiocordyceps camponoti-rufipedis TaxID=2004952 RepID=A0A2C5YMZ8_9HYPO|nr:hypothetical protein CDD80_7086 [Ophiocordyceps camponoti-rufipedis]